MLQLFYWLDCLYKTLTLLSLIIYLPPGQYPTQISKGFLLLYFNEIVLFFVSFYIQYLFDSEQYSLVEVFKLVTNVYFVVIYSLVMAWLMLYKQDLLTKNVQVLSIVFVIFSWLAFAIVGLLSVVSQEDNSITNFSTLAQDLAWVLCIVKLIVQYNTNKTQTIGLNYLFLIFTICWAISQAIYQLTIQEQDIIQKVTIALFAVTTSWISLALYLQRKDNLKQINQNITQQQGTREIIAQTQPQNILDDTLRDSLIDKNKHSDKTTYSSSFTSTIDNY